MKKIYWHNLMFVSLLQKEEGIFYFVAGFCGRYKEHIHFFATF